MSDAKFNLPFSIGLPDAVSDAVDPKIRPVLELMFNAFQQIQLAIHNYVGVGQQLKSIWPSLRYSDTLHRFSPNRLYLRASEAVIYGAAVNLHLVSGELKIRNANATNNTKPAHGFCTTSSGIAADDYGEVICNFGLLESVAGLTVGTRYFLSTSNGLITATKPVAAGNIGQVLGIAVDSTALLFNFGFHFEQF